MSTFEQTLNTFASTSWANPSWDLFIAIFFIVAALLYGFALGRDRVILIMMALYTSLAIVTNAPYIDRLVGVELSINQSIALKVTTFLGAFILLFFLLSHSALRHVLGRKSGTASWWHTLVFSFLQVGLLISVTLSFLPASTVTGLAPLSASLFLSDPGKFVWLVGPVVAMFVLKGREE